MMHNNWKLKLCRLRNLLGELNIAYGLRRFLKRRISSRAKYSSWCILIITLSEFGIFNIRPIQIRRIISINRVWIAMLCKNTKRNKKNEVVLWICFLMLFLMLHLYSTPIWTRDYGRHVVENCEARGKMKITKWLNEPFLKSPDYTRDSYMLECIIMSLISFRC